MPTKNTSTAAKWLTINCQSDPTFLIQVFRIDLMIRERHTVELRSHHHRAGNGRHTDVNLEAPFDLGLYTPEYIQADPTAKTFRDSENAWERFLAARPLLYLPDRSPITEEDPINRRRKLWTHQELHEFGDVVEERTRAQLRAQERTLRRWHSAATQIQRCYRGMRDRILVLRIRQEICEHAATLERAMELARLRRRQHKAALIIHRTLKQHRKYNLHRERAATVLQRAMRRFMRRLRRWRARLVIQRVARCYLWRSRWIRYKTLVAKMLKAAARQQQLVLAAEAFQRACEKSLLQHQAETWAAHPERMQMLLRVRYRKKNLRNSGVGVLPPLELPTKKQHTRKKTVRPAITSKNQQHLPLICHSTRGEYT